MGKAEIIADLGAGHYTIKRVWAGREAAQDKIVLINTNIAKLQSKYSLMPENTEDEIFAKHVLKLQIASLQVQVRYIQDNFLKDIVVDAYCADYAEELSGEVGTIDIPGEVTELVNIRPGYDETAAFDVERDGEFWPSIAVGPWTCFLNKCILPGWQRWKPLYREGIIVPGSIDYDNNVCGIAIQPSFSSQQNLNVNPEEGAFLIGTTISGEEEKEVDYYKQDSGAEDPGLKDFCRYNPGHPVCEVEGLAPPVELSDEQKTQLDDINWVVDTYFDYEKDSGDTWNTMYDEGAEWGLYSRDGRKVPGPIPSRPGNYEDHVLTKMQAIIESGIVPAANLQVLLCHTAQGPHVVLGLQTTNHGFMILDKVNSAQILKIEDLDYSWEAFLVAGRITVTVQNLEGHVSIEYMDCNAAVFRDNDHVIVEFTGQDWNNPKVIGFASNPVSCDSKVVYLFGQTMGLASERLTKYFACGYTPATDVWAYTSAMAEWRYPNKAGCLATKNINGTAILVSGGLIWGYRYPGHEPWPSVAIKPIDCSEPCAGILHTTLWFIWIMVYHADFYHENTDVWEAVEDYPGDRRQYHSGWCLAGQHFLCGGSDYGHGWAEYKDDVEYHNYRLGAVHDSVVSYHEIGKIYTSKMGMGIHRYGMAAFSLDGFGFVAGGGKQSMATYPSPGWDIGESTLMRYDWRADTWDEMEDLPDQRYLCTGFSANGYGFVIGGLYAKRPTTLWWLPPTYIGISKTVLKYDHSVNAWGYAQPINTEAYRLSPRCVAGAALGGNGYCATGQNHEWTYGHTNYDEYDPILDTWSAKSDYPSLTAFGDDSARTHNGMAAA